MAGMGGSQYQQMGQGIIGSLLAMGGTAGGLFASDTPQAPTLEGQLGRVFKLLYGGKNWSKGLAKGGMWPGDEPGALDDIMRLQTEQGRAAELARLQLLQEVSPQVAQLQVDLFNQFSPQYAQTQVDVQRAANPAFYGSQDIALQRMMAGAGQGLSADQTGYFAQQERAAQAARGLADSPLGSTQEARYLTELDTAQRQQNIANMFAALQQYRTINPSLPNIGIPELGAASQFQGPSIMDLFGTSVANRGAKFQQDQANWQNQQGIYGGMAGTGYSMFADSFSQGGGGGGGGMDVGSMFGGGGGGGGGGGF